MDASITHRWPTLTRSRLVADLEHHLTTLPRGCPGIVLSGPAGSGASVLLELLSRRRAGLTVRNGRLRPDAAGPRSGMPSSPVGDLVAALRPGSAICIDDLAQVPGELAADLLDAATAHQVPVVATVRARQGAALSASHHPLRHLQVVPVPALSGGQIERLCAGRLGAPIEPLTLRRLVDLSDGWPGPVIAVVEHNLRLGSLRLRRGLIGAGALALPPSLTGPGSPLVHARAGPSREALERVAADGPLDRAAADAVAGAGGIDDLLADGLLQTTLDGPTVLVDLTPRARDVLMVAGPAGDLPGRVAAIRTALREGRPQRANELAERLRDEGIRARRSEETVCGTLLLAEAQLESGSLDDAETSAARALCLLESVSPSDALVPECLALAALCAAWRSAGPQARRLAAEVESHLQSSGGRAAVRLAETDLLLGDAIGASRRARRVAASPASPDVALAARAVLARIDPGQVPADPPSPASRQAPGDDGAAGRVAAWADADSARHRLVRALVARDGQALLSLARSWASAGLGLLAADTAARAEPLLRSGGDTAAAGRAGHLAANLLAGNGIDRPAGWPSTGTGGLTPREREIAALAVGGATTAEVAAALQLSVRTVENHLQHCYTKCGVGSRQELGEILGWASNPGRPSIPAQPPTPRPAALSTAAGGRPARTSTRVPVSASPGGR